MPLAQCGCGELFAPAPEEQHVRIVDRHKSESKHRAWVASGGRAVTPRKQVSIAAMFSSTSVVASSPASAQRSSSTLHGAPGQALTRAFESAAHQPSSMLVTGAPSEPHEALTPPDGEKGASFHVAAHATMQHESIALSGHLRPCRGVNLLQRLDWCPSGSTFLDHFAAAQLQTAALAGVVISSDGYFRSRDCMGPTSTGLCACEDLFRCKQAQLHEMRETAKQSLTASSVKYIWRTTHQLRQALVSKDEARNAMKIQVAALRVSSQRAAHTNQVCHRRVCKFFYLRANSINSYTFHSILQTWYAVTKLLAERRVPQLCSLLKRCLERRMRPATVVERLMHAAEKVVEAGFWDGAERDLARLLYSIAGDRALRPVQKMFSTIGGRRVRQLHGAQRFEVTLSRRGAHADAVANLRFATRVLGTVRKPRSFAFDGAALRLAVELDATKRRLRGLCLEHCPDSACHNEVDVLALHSLLLDGKVHLAREAVIFGLSSVGETQSHLIPVLAAGVCGKGSEDFNVGELLRAGMESWQTMPATDSSAETFATVFGDIVTVGSDAASSHRRLFDTIFREPVVSSVLRVGGRRGLPSIAIDLPGAEFGPLIMGTATWIFDWLHIAKRLRQALLRGLKVSRIDDKSLLYFEVILSPLPITGQWIYSEHCLPAICIGARPLAYSRNDRLHVKSRR